MHRVVALALDNVVPFDLAVPNEVFSRAALPDGRPAYNVVVCGPTARPRPLRAGPVLLTPSHGIGALESADTVIVAGIDPFVAVRPAVVGALRAAAERGARVASICGGAFVLASTGLLDGLAATTHWSAAKMLADLFPAVRVEPDVLYVDNGQLLSSAGAAASFDLCLHMVRCDFGAEVAARAAKLAVMPLERAGGQAQFIDHPPPVADDRGIGALLEWITANLDGDLSLRSLANRAAMSERTLSRRFRDQTGTTPQQWVQRVRVIRARQLLETTDLAVERIAALVGYSGTSTLRAHFQKTLRTNPLAYRRSYRQPGQPANPARPANLV